MKALKQRVLARATEVGFARCGVARAEALGVEAEHFRNFLAQQRHGDMDYLEETADVRVDPSHAGMLPSAKSVIMLATPYARHDAPGGPAPGQVARYAQGRDYHNVLHKRANKVAKVLRAAGFNARAVVDSFPVMERAWAQRAGLGFIGKNCCLIIPGIGSHVLLAAVITSAELEPDAPMRERCGACTLCLDRCPTRAFVGPREMDARRCISYLTIEQQGPIPEALRSSVEGWVFGCDACQDVCPFNATSKPAPATTELFAAGERWHTETCETLLQMDEVRFTEYAQGSALKRPGRVGMARNAAVVLGNRGDKRHLPVLAQTALEHDSAMVREAASWAAREIEARESEPEP